MMIKRWLVPGALLCVAWPVALAAGEVRVDCDFPGGNVLVDSIAGDAIRVRPDLRDTSTWWFYWYFRVRGAAGRTLQVEFTDGQPVGVRGPAVSTDGGKTWRWQGADHGTSRSFSYRFAAEDNEVRFAYTIPYLQADWERFLAAHQGNRLLRPGVLGRSRHDRPVEFAYIGDPSICCPSAPIPAGSGSNASAAALTPGDGTPDSAPQHRILLTARHHACETMASFALEGLLQTVLAGDTDEGRWLAEHAELLVVPFVDKDGVEAGDQGKNRRPRDHNRDYSGDSIYRETAALRELAPRWSEGKLHVALDLHCPWIRGEHNEEIYLVGSPNAGIWAEQQQFGRILEEVQRGPLPYRAADNLPFGVAWNQGGNYTEGLSFSQWAGGLPSIKLAASLELPYANARGAEVTADGARAFGKDLACALSRYLAAVAK